MPNPENKSAETKGALDNNPTTQQSQQPTGYRIARIRNKEELPINPDDFSGLPFTLDPDKPLVGFIRTKAEFLNPKNIPDLHQTLVKLVVKLSENPEILKLCLENGYKVLKDSPVAEVDQNTELGVRAYLAKDKHHAIFFDKDEADKLDNPLLEEKTGNSGPRQEVRYTIDFHFKQEVAKELRDGMIGPSFLESMAYVLSLVFPRLAVKVDQRRYLDNGIKPERVDNVYGLIFEGEQLRYTIIPTLKLIQDGTFDLKNFPILPDSERTKFERTSALKNGKFTSNVPASQKNKAHYTLFPYGAEDANPSASKNKNSNINNNNTPQ